MVLAVARSPLHEYAIGLLYQRNKLSADEILGNLGRIGGISASSIALPSIKDAARPVELIYAHSAPSDNDFDVTEAIGLNLRL